MNPSQTQHCQTKVSTDHGQTASRQVCRYRAMIQRNNKRSQASTDTRLLSSLVGKKATQRMAKGIGGLLLMSSLLSFAYADVATTRQVDTKTPQIKMVSYSNKAIVPIVGTSFYATQVIFAQDEKIVNIQSGDPDAWTIQAGSQPNTFFLKPTVDESNTNLIVTTNKHTYYFALSVAKPGSTTQPSYVFKFSYPADKLKALNAKFASKQTNSTTPPVTTVQAMAHRTDYNWHYNFSGSKTIVPLHVFDDGTKTYMELQPHQPVPAVFVVNNPNGSEAVVNYRKVSNYLIINQVAPQFTLRAGDAVASIFNQPMIDKRQGQQQG